MGWGREGEWEGEEDVRLRLAVEIPVGGRGWLVLDAVSGMEGASVSDGGERGADGVDEGGGCVGCGEAGLDGVARGGGDGCDEGQHGRRCASSGGALGEGGREGGAGEFQLEVGVWV